MYVPTNCKQPLTVRIYMTRNWLWDRLLSNCRHTHNTYISTSVSIASRNSEFKFGQIYQYFQFRNCREVRIRWKNLTVISRYIDLSAWYLRQTQTLVWQMFVTEICLKQMIILNRHLPACCLRQAEAIAYTRYNLIIVILIRISCQYPHMNRNKISSNR